MGDFSRDLVVSYVVDMKLRRILMGIRKTDPGRGIIIGPGGHMEPEDCGDPVNAALREVRQEVSLIFEEDQVVQIGQFNLRFENKPDLSPVLHTFLIFGSSRGAIETEEMIPVECYFSDLWRFYPRMLEGENMWLEPALWNIRSKGTIVRERPLGKLISMDIVYL